MGVEETVRRELQRAEAGSDESRLKIMEDVYVTLEAELEDPELDVGLGR